LDPGFFFLELAVRLSKSNRTFPPDSARAFVMFRKVVRSALDSWKEYH